MSLGFVKDASFLAEKINDEDLLDIDKSISELSSKIDLVDKNAFIGIIGSFGIGKSTLINNVKNVRSDAEEEKWIYFDAWQFPERKELWEGLILDTARQIGELETTKRKIDGEGNKDKVLATDTATKIGNIFLPMFAPAISLVGDTMKYFLQESPAKRVFEMQEVFSSLLNKIQQERIIFVLEDVDRSGEDGLFFLETFKQFISNLNIEKQIIVIIPISNDSYFSHLDTYLKCLDYVEFFTKSDKDLSKFVSSFFIESTNYERELLTEFLSYIYKEYPDMTLRKIKLVLRQANLNYIELSKIGYQPDKLICIAVQMSKYINSSQNTTKITYFEQWKKNRTISSSNIISRLICLCGNVFRTYSNEKLLSNEGSIGHTGDIKLSTRDKPDNIKSYPSIPYVADIFTASDNRNAVLLPDFYFFDL